MAMRSLYELRQVIIHGLIHCRAIEEPAGMECLAVLAELSGVVDHRTQEEPLDPFHADGASG